MGRTTLVKRLMLFVGGIMLALLAMGCSPRPQSQAEQPATAPEPEIPRVNLAESKAAFDNGTAIFVDVRTASFYATSHIPGALSIPLADIEGRINELDPNQWIITYCT